MFSEYFNQYLGENLPEEERLVDYLLTNSFIYTRRENYKDGDDIEVCLTAYVFPASSKTVWSKDKKIMELEYYDEKTSERKHLEGYFTDRYYLRLVKENDKYVIKFMDNLPEGYSEFVQRIKDKTGLDLENINYADFTNAKSKTEVIADAAEKSKLESSKKLEAEKLFEERVSLIIASICTFLIVVIMFNYSRYLIKR